MHKCEKLFVCDDLHFGFQKGKGTHKALFAVRTLIEFYVYNQTNVFAASLDLSKAFDKVNHFGLLIKLMERGISLNVSNVLIELIVVLVLRCLLHVNWS